jgi:hypothetical protein
MRESKVHFIWNDPPALRDFRTGVSLHGHTMHSRECLSFLPRYLHQVPGISQIVRRYERPLPGAGPAIDFARAYWTPPLSPATALSLERKQIEELGLQPLVSLTDHDDIEAPMSLQVTANRGEVPVSVEWTVPYGATFLHLGIHNLPLSADRSWMAAMAAYTSEPDEARLPELLSSLHRIPDALIVLNHPFWREEGVGEPEHQIALDRLLRECLEWIHAFELNATRSWRENAATIALARSYGRPLISGGDRHACEPSGNINLTNAQSFSEFVTEIREDSSTLLFMPQYREPLGLRILEASWDILRPYPEYPGRERWTDRIFYHGEDGRPRPLSVIWKDRAPWMLNSATGVLQLLATSKLRAAMRLLLMQRGEALP